MMRGAALLLGLAAQANAQDDCPITSLFAHLQTIQSSPDCCPTGSCASGETHGPADTDALSLHRAPRPHLA